MFCQKCGNQIQDEAVVCIHCGCAVEPKKEQISLRQNTLNSRLFKKM
ncbi:MAG: zinc-ribbon domain-containing protein [Clostridia bacterium]|nr:zinc-ribbon domain-containing protein [Clostridia bacterium]